MELIYKYSLYSVNETTPYFNVVGEVKFSNNIKSFDGCVNSTTLIDWQTLNVKEQMGEIIVTFKQGIYNNIKEDAEMLIKSIFLNINNNISK